MKKQEIDYLERLHDCLSVPGWSNKQTLPSGQLQYAIECREILPRVQSLLRLIAVGESYQGEIKEELQQLENIRAKQKQLPADAGRS